RFHPERAAGAGARPGESPDPDAARPDSRAHRLAHSARARGTGPGGQRPPEQDHGPADGPQPAHCRAAPLTCHGKNGRPLGGPPGAHAHEPRASRQGNPEAGSLADLTLGSHLSAMAFHDAAYEGQADASAFELLARMQPAKRREQAACLALIETRPVVAHAVEGMGALLPALDLNPGILGPAGELDG